MNDDIVHRLREGIGSTNHFGIVDAEQVMEAAAKEIERLRANCSASTPTDDNERLAGDLLVGADAIRAYLVHLGWPESVDPYYLKRSRNGGWPIGNTAGTDGKIIASKRLLIRHIEKLTHGNQRDHGSGGAQ